MLNRATKVFKPIQISDTDKVDLEYHTHIDAVGDVLPAKAIKAFLELGFEAYNFPVDSGCDADRSDLVVNIGEGRSQKTNMFVLNFKTDSRESAIDMADKAKKIMEDFQVNGYIEVERVYRFRLENQLFEPEAFDCYFPLHENGGRHLPVLAKKSPLSKTDFSTSEIHLTVPRSIDDKQAINGDLLKSLFDMGFYGPDVIKTVAYDFDIASRQETYETVVDIPLTVSAENGRELLRFSNAVLGLLQRTGWTNDTGLTKEYPLDFKFEIMESHYWIGSLNPATTYRDVLKEALFNSDPIKREVDNYGGTILGRKLYAPNQKNTVTGYDIN